MPVLTHSTGEGEGKRKTVMNLELATEKYKDFCPICNAPDIDSNLCRCDYPTDRAMIDLLRTIYAEDTTTEKIKQLIEEVFRP